MSDDNNPYSPPEADLGDGGRTRLARSRPPQILQAIALLWISSGLGLASGFLEAQRGAETDAVLVMVIETLVLLGVLTFTIWRGRNWGRIFYVLLVALSLAAFLASWGEVVRPAFEVELEAVSFVADAGSFFLMFTNPGSLWFRTSTDQ